MGQSVLTNPQMKERKSSLFPCILGRKYHSIVIFTGERRTDVEETFYIFVALKVMVITVSLIHIFIPNAYNCDSL